MSEQPNGINEHKRRAERARIIWKACQQRAEIEQAFIDAASWNQNSQARKQGADPVDPDPDGLYRKMADDMDLVLAGLMPLDPLPPILSAATLGAMAADIRKRHDEGVR